MLPTVLWEVCWGVKIGLQLSWSFILLCNHKPFFLPHELLTLLLGESPYFPLMSSTFFFVLGAASVVFFFSVGPLKSIHNHWAVFPASEIQTEGSLFNRSQMSEVDDTPQPRVTINTVEYDRPTCGLNWHTLLTSDKEIVFLFFFSSWKLSILLKKWKRSGRNWIYRYTCMSYRSLLK